MPIIVIIIKTLTFRITIFSVKTCILVQVVLGFMSKTQCNFKCVMTCRLICQTVRTYGCRLNSFCRFYHGISALNFFGTNKGWRAVA